MQPTQYGYSLNAMATNAMATKDVPLTLTEVIDHVESIRDELLTIQRALEKMERAQIGGLTPMR